MSYGTTHIRQMLAQAIDACEKADALMAKQPKDVGWGESVPEYMVRRDDDVQRLLQGAVFNAQHAAAEIQDERFRLKYGEDGYTR